VSKPLDIEGLKALCRDDVPAMKPWRVLFLENVPALVTGYEKQRQTLAVVQCGFEELIGKLMRVEEVNLAVDVGDLRRLLADALAASQASTSEG
jgi:hypothetical protein